MDIPINCEKDNTLVRLIKLHEQAKRFIEEMKNGKSGKTIPKEQLKEFENLTNQLEETIVEAKDSNCPLCSTYEEWCELLGDSILDDDNFYIEEDGFRWY